MTKEQAIEMVAKSRGSLSAGLCAVEAAESAGVYNSPWGFVSYDPADGFTVEIFYEDDDDDPDMFPHDEHTGLDMPGGYGS